VQKEEGEKVVYAVQLFADQNDLAKVTLVKFLCIKEIISS
jgi:hypothetical protein